VDLKKEHKKFDRQVRAKKGRKEGGDFLVPLLA
jgi:hypothetical protein